MTTFKYNFVLNTNMDAEIALKQLGLTDVESNVYLALLKLGSTTTGPLVKKTELHRATVYDALKRLMEKGLVNYIIKQKTKYFEATDPSHLLDLIIRQKEEIEKKENITKTAIKELQKVKELAKQKQIAHIFQGARGVKTVFEDILKYKKNWVFGSSGRFRDVLGTYFYQFQKRKTRLKILTHHLVSERVKGTDIIGKKPYGITRYLPKEYESPTSIIAYDNKVATFVWTEMPIAFLIESRQVANSYRNYFKLLWKMAKK